MSWNFASSWNTASSRLFKKLRSQMKQWNLTACSAHWSAAEKWISFIKSEHPDALWILQRKSSASFSYLLMKRVLVMCFEHEALIQDEGSYPASTMYLFVYLQNTHFCHSVSVQPSFVALHMLKASDWQWATLEGSQMNVVKRAHSPWPQFQFISKRSKNEVLWLGSVNYTCGAGCMSMPCWHNVAETLWALF